MKRKNRRNGCIGFGQWSSLFCWRISFTCWLSDVEYIEILVNSSGEWIVMGFLVRRFSFSFSFFSGYLRKGGVVNKGAMLSFSELIDEISWV